MPHKTYSYGSVRQRKTHSKTAPQLYWEGRITVGYDENGRQLQRTVTAKTKKLL